MKKISTVGVKQTKNFREQRLTIGLEEIDGVGIACWMKRGTYCWNKS